MLSQSPKNIRCSPIATSADVSDAVLPLADPEASIALLTAESHLIRSRAHAQLQSCAPSAKTSELLSLADQAARRLEGAHPWYVVLGGVMTCEVLVPIVTDESFEQSVLVALHSIMQHTEPRVRVASGSLIGALAARRGPAVWHELVPHLLRYVEDNFVLDESVRLDEASKVATRELDAESGKSKTASAMLHETEGWKCLETMLGALTNVIKGCGVQVLSEVGPQEALSAVSGLGTMISFVQRASDHTNRFIREAGLKLLDALLSSAKTIREQNDECTVVHDIGMRCLEVVRNGLQDNWSQVRFCACVAARTLLQAFTADEREMVYGDLLPRMCLNRHYVAEGVRQYSHETWRTVVGQDGRRVMQERIGAFIEFYQSQCKADNHAVREAACQSLSEAALRLESGVVEDWIAQVVDGLIGGFKDESWPVRDHACRSLAAVTEAFGEKVRESGRVEEIMQLFERHLGDNIMSVRRNCGEGYVTVGVQYADDEEFGVKRVGRVAGEHLARMKDQPESKANSTPKQMSNTQFGASTKLSGVGVDDDAAHTNQVMYSCGSLAPKLRRGGGCSDHGFVRPREMWELADGGVYVWSALMRSGAAGRVVAVDMVDEVLQCATVGCAKTWGGKRRWIGRWLEAVREGVMIGGNEVQWSDERVRIVMQVVVQAECGNDAASRSCAAFRRVFISKAGLRNVARAERTVKENGVKEC